MLPYNNTGKYHETPAGYPMLHAGSAAIEHGLTDAFVSLSPSSQLMYEPEVIAERMSCGAGGQGQVRVLSVPSTADGRTPEDGGMKSEDIISPSVEVMTFKDCNDAEGLFGSPSSSSGHGMTFGEYCNSEGLFIVPSSGSAYANGGKRDGTFGVSTMQPMTFEGFVAPDDVFRFAADGGTNRDKLEVGGGGRDPYRASVRGTNFENRGNSYYGINFDDGTLVTPGGIKREDDEGRSDEIFGPTFQDLTYVVDDDSVIFDASGIAFAAKPEEIFGASSSSDVVVEGPTFRDRRGKPSSGGMNPIVEGMTLDEKTMKELLSSSSSNEADAGDWLEFEKDVYEELARSDCGGLIAAGDGPTLTQLNSDDLDATLLDDFDVMSELYTQHLNRASEDATKKPAAPYRVVLVSNFLPVGFGVVAASPRFTTCTMTSFTTSVSDAMPRRVVGGERPLPAMQDLSSSCRPKSSARLMVTDPSVVQMTQLMTSVVPLTSSNLGGLHFLPVLAGGTHQPVGFIGNVVLPGNTSTYDVSEALASTYETTSSAKTWPETTTEGGGEPEKKWEELMQYGENRNAATTQATSKRTRRGTERNDVAFNPVDEMMMEREMSEPEDSAESGLEDSDIENNEIDHSDDESVGSKSESPIDYDAAAAAGSRKESKKYFWQYNTQSKGPKGKRLCKSVETEDPHVLHDFEDPVFDPEQNQTRYKHNGKARRGDGNDITPNPYKLFVTGNELRKLNRLINAITPAGDVPANARSKMLKEKNKYASRACRLKKKAQHEANKLKLYGLELEHRQLMRVLGNIKIEITKRVKIKNDTDGETMSNKLERFIQQHQTQTIAGRTADFVNKILQRVADGDRTGGINLDE